MMVEVVPAAGASGADVPGADVPGAEVSGAEPAAEGWSVAEAKARLSELLHQVDVVGPQVITRRGRQVAVVVSTEEWHQKSHRQGSLAEFFAWSPLAGSELDLTRGDTEPREVPL